MRSTKRRVAGLLATLVAFGLVGAACGDDSGTAANSSGGNGAASSAAPSMDYSKLTGTLNGSGSSFVDPFLQEAKTRFAPKASGLTVNYTKSGSGAGRQDLQNQVVQFAGTDSLPKPEDKAGYKGGDYLLFPDVAAPITVSYNVSGIEDKVQLSSDTLAKIFSTQIATWNDPAIAADNPDLKNLPATPIHVVHRSDASGTTSNFTKYLAAAAPSVWTLGSGDTIQWPPSTQGAEKNSGVATTIKTTDGAVGYVDLADAVNADLNFASVKNSAGNYVQPSLEGAAAALEGTKVNPDLTYNPLNASGDQAYPITSPTWIITYVHQGSQAQADAMKGWLNFILTDGQDFAGKVGYAKLPDQMKQMAIAQLDQITV